MAKNYCRNPTKDVLGPWCFTTELNIRREYCMIHLCNEPPADTCPECTEDRLGVNYHGKMNRTIYGHACTYWTKINESFIISDNFPDNTVDEAFNYCRNPSSKIIGPLCLAQGTDFVDRCGIPICGVSDDLNNIYTNYIGDIYTKTTLLDIADGIIIFFLPDVLFGGTILNGLSLCTFSQPALIK